MRSFSLDWFVGPFAKRREQKKRKFRNEAEVANALLSQAREAGSLDASLEHLRAYKALVGQSSFKKRYASDDIQKVLAEYVLERARETYFESLPFNMRITSTPQLIHSDPSHYHFQLPSFEHHIWYAVDIRKHKNVRQLYEHIDDVVDVEFEPRVNGLMDARKVKKLAVDAAYQDIQIALIENAKSGFEILGIAALYEQVCNVYAEALGCDFRGVPHPENVNVVYDGAIEELFQQLDDALDMDAEMLVADPTYLWFEQNIATLQRYVNHANEAYLGFDDAVKLRSRVEELSARRDIQIAPLAQELGGVVEA